MGEIMNKIKSFVLVVFLLVPVFGWSAGQPDLAVIKNTADQGDALAQAQVGAIYYLGKGVMQDPAIAARWLKKAADQGLVEAAVTMGALSDVGLGVPPSASDARAWYQKAVALGSEPAKGVLGYYTDVERAMKAMGIAKQYANLILRKK